MPMSLRGIAEAISSPLKGEGDKRGDPHFPIPLSGEGREGEGEHERLKEEL